MPDPLRDVVHSHTFQHHDDLRRPLVNVDDDWLFRAMTSPQNRDEPAPTVPSAVEPLSDPSPRRASLEHAEIPTPRTRTHDEAAISLEAPQRSTAAHPSFPEAVSHNTPRSVMNTEDLVSPVTDLDTSHLSDQLESRLQELAQRLSRRIDDQFARVMFTQHAQM